MHERRFSNPFLRTIVEVSDFGVMALDAEGRIIAWNPWLAERTAVPEAQVLGKPLSAALRDVPQTTLDACAQVLQTGRPRILSPILHKSLIPVTKPSQQLGRLYPIHNDDNRNVGVVLFINDVSPALEYERFADAELRASEENFRRSLEESPLGVRIVSPEGDTIFANRTLLDIYGYDNIDELQKKPAHDRYTPESYAGFLARREKRRLGVDDPSSYEISVFRKDGTIRVLQVFRKEVAWSGKRQYQVLYNDITERRRTERALQESEERLRKEEKFSQLLLDTSPAYIVAIGFDGKTLMMNQSLLDVLGYSAAEIRGVDYVTTFVPEADRAGLIEIFKEIARDEKPTVNENRIISKSGRTFLVEWHGRSVSQEGKYLDVFVGVGIDITARKQAEEELKISEERYRAFVRQSSEAICLFEVKDAPIDTSLAIDEQINLLYAQAVIGECNQTFATSHGYTDPEEMNGFRIGQIFPRLARENVAYLRSFLEQGCQTSDVCTKELAKDGTVRYFLNSLIGQREDGRLLRLWGVKQDITRMRLAEEEIRALNTELERRVRQRTAELEAANRELEAFSYSVSHDLRAPLRAIGGYTRLLIDDFAADLDQEGKRICSIIEANTRRMGRLIEDLLAFSRLGRAEMRRVPVDMGDLAMKVFQELTEQADRQRIDLHLGGLPGCLGDPAMMRHVWTNLLSNALKFSSLRERALIEITARRDEGETIYTVRDNGAGFDMRYVHKIFGVFQRLHSEREFDGNGVGLSIVQRLIARHGGRVWAEGEVDRGAAISFALPNQ